MCECKGQIISTLVTGAMLNFYCFQLLKLNSKETMRAMTCFAGLMSSSVSELIINTVLQPHSYGHIPASP